MWDQHTLQFGFGLGVHGSCLPKSRGHGRVLSLLAAQSRVVPGSISAANLGSGFDRWSRSSPAGLTQQGPTLRIPAVPLDPDREGPESAGKGFGSDWCSQGKPGMVTQGVWMIPLCIPGEEPCWDTVVSLPPTPQILLNPILPPSAFPALQRQPWIIFFS